jgi:flagellar hook-length control protein FliK
MSQDLMQTLSGSSLLSVAIGTLPAGKQGMSLDANPFASQLALMTGTDAAVTGALAPAAAIPATGEGAFAAALNDLAAPVLADAPASALVAADAAPIVPTPTSSAPLGAAPQIVAALPEDASATQIIVAALTGSASVEDPVVAVAVAVAVADPRAASETTPAAPKALAPQPAAPVVAVPQTSTPYIQTGTGTPATVLPVAQVLARPVMVIDAPMPAEALLMPAPKPEVVLAEEAATLPSDTPRPHRRARAEAAVLTPEVPGAIAMAQAPIVQLLVQPEAPVTDLGTTRILTKAALQAPRPAASDDTAVLPAIAPTGDQGGRAQVAQSAAMSTDPIAQEPLPDLAADAAVPAEMTSAPIVAPVATGQTALDLAAPIAQGQAAAEPRPMASVAPLATAPGATQTAAQPAASVMASPDPVAPAARAVPEAAPAIAAAPSTSSATPLGNDAPATFNAQQQAAPQVQAQPAQAQPAQAQPAQAQQVAAPVIQAVQTQQVQPASVSRTAATTPRATFTPAARRVVDAAAQSPRPAEALSALFDRADLDIDPAAAFPRTDFPAPAPMEAVPPSWAAALNAVTSPSQQLAGVAAPQASAPANAAPLETLNFDAGFVANIETQIARVANGGQMVRMQIMPENLGRIDIEMLAGPERDQVRIVTEHDAVRDTLVSSQHRLEQDLRSNAQRPTEVTVELRQQSPGTQNGSAQQQQQRGQSGAEAASAREAAQRQATGDPAAEAAPATRRPRGNVRYA